MSFNQFSPELLMKVFSRLLNIPTKIRLERVNKRFRDCIRNTESWKYNTTLRMSEIGSEKELLSFLKHAKVITEFYLDVSGLSSNYFGTLFMFSDKLKVKLFASLKVDCPKHDLVVACCLGKFASTLETVKIACCFKGECPILLTLGTMLPLCLKLTEVRVGNIKKNENPEGNDVLLSSLMHLSLETILLFDFYSPINGQHLAAVCNSAKDHCVSSIDIRHTRAGPCKLVRFQLAEFCHSLEPAAAQAIKSLNFVCVDCGWVDLLPTLPAVFPNLARVELEECPRNATAEDAMKENGPSSRRISAFRCPTPGRDDSRFVSEL